jgi:hypothetical protein
MAWQLKQRLACEMNGAYAGLRPAAQTIQECRLAGPISGRLSHRSGLDIKRYIVQGHDPTEVHRQSFD